MADMITHAHLGVYKLRGYHGYGYTWGSKFGISHWNGRSPLQQLTVDCRIVLGAYIVQYTIRIFMASRCGLSKKVSPLESFISSYY